MQTAHANRRYWLPQLIALILLALLGTLPFWLSDLDIRVATLFFHPGTSDPWFGSRHDIWLILYQSAPLMAGLLALGSLAVLAAGTLWPRYRRLRLYAVFMIATSVLGPGLVVNALLKDHWGRPRPHQTVELGGTQPYLPPLAMGESGKGKSFPCGHSSAGFLFGAFFLIWLRRRPRLARLALAGSIVLGVLLGVGRMAAGDHFLSDIIWSAVVVHGLALLLYYAVLRIPQREDAEDAAAKTEIARPEGSIQRHPIAFGTAYALTALVLLAGVLLATPVHQNRSRTVVSSHYDPPPRVLRLIADEAQVQIAWHQWSDHSALILLKGRGFGLPGTQVRDQMTARDGVLTFEVEHRGLFTEKDTSLIVGLVPEDWDRVVVQTQVGDIRVYPPPPGAPSLDLRTGKGQVQRDVPEQPGRQHRIAGG